MSKFFFVLLLLANGALFAYHQGLFEVGAPGGREPARLLNQLNADKLKLVPESTALGQTSAASPASTSGNDVAAATNTSAAGTAGPATAADGPSQPANPKPGSNEVIACTEIGDFEPVDARRFEARLGSLSLGERLTRRAVADIRHIVFIPSTGGKEAADKKAGELRRLGVTDFFIIQENSPMKWGISLGIFKTEEAARAHLTALSQRGVRSARLGTQNTNSNKVAFRLQQLEPASRTALEAIKADFSAQQIRACEPEKAAILQ
ncbi:hypothetical protein BH11PSE11_BH11PSE11_00370 [soil metagenome]